MPRALVWGNVHVETFYAPVHTIGGDFGLVAPKDDSHLNLLVCDVAGHGIGSALIANRIYTETGVRYLGHVDERTLSALYEAAGALAFPSLYEGFGLPLLEAMAHGVPCVVGNAGALPELAGDAALLVDPEDVGAIEVALDHALTDTELRERLSAAGKERAAAFTWERTAALTRDVLRKIAR